VAVSSNFESITENERQSIAQAELFQLHFTHWRSAICGAISLVAVVGTIFLYLTNNTASLWWIGLLTSAYLVQAAFCIFYERKSPHPGSNEFMRWMWIWTLLTSISGLISGALVFFVPANQVILLFAAIMISGAFAIGEACAWGHERLVYAAIIPQALTTCIALEWHAQLPLAVIICVLFTMIMLHFGRELNRAMLSGIVQRLYAQQLAIQLERDQQSVLEAQHLQSVLAERQRLMQDMHDGLGSALMSSLILLERGELTVPQATVVMRECLDDLRLVVDSLEPTSKDLATLLGMLRYRLQYRLDAAGVHLRWQMEDLPALPWLEPSLALDLLRLTQEAITNALRHSEAKNLTLMAWKYNNHIELLLHDDGCGFDPAETKLVGHGIRTMQSRAQRLHADLAIESTPNTGVKISLRLPIELPEFNGE